MVQQITLNNNHTSHHKRLTTTACAVVFFLFVLAAVVAIRSIRHKRRELGDASHWERRIVWFSAEHIDHAPVRHQQHAVVRVCVRTTHVRHKTGHAIANVLYGLTPTDVIHRHDRRVRRVDVRLQVVVRGSAPEMLVTE